MCRYCDKMYQPSGVYQKICDSCGEFMDKNKRKKTQRRIN